MSKERKGGAKGSAHAASRPIDSGLHDVSTPLDRETRSRLVLQIVNKIIPISTVSQHLQAVAVARGVTTAELDREDRFRYGGNLERDSTRKKFVNLFSDTPISDSDMEQYIATVYETAKLVVPEDEAPDEEVRNLVRFTRSLDQAHLFRDFAEKWNDRFLVGKDNYDIYSSRKIFVSLVDAISAEPQSAKSNPRDPNASNQLVDVFLEGFELLYQRIPDIRIGDHESQYMIRITEGTNQVDHLRRFIYGITEVSNASQVYDHFVTSIGQYAINHGLSDVAVQGLVSKFFPALENDEPQVKILKSSQIAFGQNEGDFGIGDFICHAYAQPVTPPNINELFMIARELPTTLLARLEQIRSDSIIVNDSFYGLQNIIHDQKPYVNELISSMIIFYETGDSRHLLIALEKIGPEYVSEKVRAAFLTKDKYEDEYYDEIGRMAGVHQTIRAIEILRRIAENTQSFVDEKPPQTSDSELNKLAQSIGVKKIVTKDELKKTFDYVNTSLTQMMQSNEVGIGPNHILMFAWIERKGFEAIQKLTFEEQIGAYRQEWFHAILSFQELTASPTTFDEVNFQQFLSEVTHAESAEVAYRLIFQRTMKNRKGLADKYIDMGRADRVGALWSGNITHELIGLVDPREGETAVGKRLSKEVKKEPHLRRTGD